MVKFFYKLFQVPQFILEDAAERQQGVRIFCTQPRRLPVLAVSARVAKERNEKLGSTVGYHIRLEQKYAFFSSSFVQTKFGFSLHIKFQNP